MAESPIKTDIPPRERLIFALDVPDLDRARELIRTLGDSVVSSAVRARKSSPT